MAQNQLERWKILSEIAKNAALFAGIIVGGIWALYQFSALLSVNQATAELERTSLENEEKRRSLIEQPILNIEIDLQQSKLGDQAWRLQGEVIIQNTGTFQSTLTFDQTQPAISLVRLERPEGHTIYLDRQFYRIHDHEHPIETMIVLVGRKISIPFFFDVPRPGLYLVSFEAAVTPGGERQQDEVARLHGISHAVWQQLKTIEIPE